jgi:hypothetical protein
VVNEVRFDFSQESDIYDKLWQMMEKKQLSLKTDRGITREEVTADSLFAKPKTAPERKEASNGTKEKKNTITL